MAHTWLTPTRVNRSDRTQMVWLPIAVITALSLPSCGTKNTAPGGAQWTPKSKPGAAPSAGPPSAPVTGHSAPILDVSFAPDGKSLLTAGADSVAKLWDVAERKAVADLKGHGGIIRAAAYSPSGALVVTGGHDKALRIWDVANRKLITTLGAHDREIVAITFSADGKLFASASQDATVKLWDTKTFKEVRTLHCGDVQTIAFAPDGKTFVTAGGESLVRIWDVISGDTKGTLEGHTGVIHRAIYFPDGKTLATCAEDKTVVIWDVSARKRVRSLDAVRELFSLAVSPDGKRLAAGTGKINSAPPQPGIVTIWDTSTWNRLATLEGHVGSVWGIAFSPDSGSLATVSGDKTLRLWDVASLKLVTVFRGVNVPGQVSFMMHLTAVNAVSYSRDGKLIATGCANGSVQLWDPASRDEVRTIEAHKGAAHSVAFTPDGETLATGGDEPDIKLWHANSGELIGLLSDDPGPIFSLAVTTDGKRLVSGSGDGAVRVWDLVTKQILSSLDAKPGPVRSVACSPDSQLIAASAANEIRIWDGNTGSELKTLRGHSRDVVQLQFAQDGSKLASASEDGTAMLWNVATGESLTLARHVGPVRSVAFTRDGAALITAGDDKTIRYWDASNGDLQFSWLRRHIGPITGLALNDMQIASVSTDRELKLWDLNPPSESEKFVGHRGRVWRIAVSPDGHTLATGSADHTVRLWEIATGRPLGVFQLSEAVRDLAFCPTQPVLAVVSFMLNTMGGELKLWDLRTGDEITSALPLMPFCSSAAFSPDGQYLATAFVDSKLHIWDFPSMKHRAELAAGSGVTLKLAFSPDGTLLAGGGTDRRLRLWRVGDWEVHNVLTGHTKPLLRVAFSPDGSILASAGEDRTARLWNPQDGSELAMLTGPKSYITELAFSPDSNRIAATTWEEPKIFLWDTRTHDSLRTLGDSEDRTTYDGIAFLPSGDQLASAQHSKLVMWDVSDRNGQLNVNKPQPGNEQLSLTVHTDVVRDVVFAPNGQTFASRSDDRTVRIWDPAQYKVLSTLREGQWSVGCIAYSPDSTRLAIGAGPYVSLWDVATGDRIARLGSHEGQRVYSIEFSPDGTLVASGSGYDRDEPSRPGQIKIWNASEFREQAALPEQPGMVNELSFAADSRTIASSQWGWTRTPGDAVTQNRLWDVAAAAQRTDVKVSDDSRLILLPGDRFVESAGEAVIFREISTGNLIGQIDHLLRRRPITAKSHDGKTIAVECYSKTPHDESPKPGLPKGQPDILIVDCDHMTGRWIKTAGPQGILGLALSRDGKLLAAIRNDHTVTVADTATGQHLITLQGHRDEVNDVTFSPDGDTIITASSDNTLRVWRVR